MIPRIVCRNCSNELTAAEKFCGSCGAEVEWKTSAQPAESPAQVAGSVRCAICGHQNSSDAQYCESCGNLLRSGKSAASSQKKGSKSPDRKAPRSSTLQAFQSWKLTVGLAIVLIAVLVILTMNRKETVKEPMKGAMPPSPQMSEAVLNEIESLQGAVDKNPNDEQSMLRLANRLQDAKFLPRAITMYQRYLQLKPSDPDARVDLGVSYFELSLSDSTKRTEYMNAAMKAMQEALKYSPKHQLAFFNLGMVSLHMGNMEQANEWFKKCEEIDPNSETGQKAQQLLHQHKFTNS